MKKCNTELMKEIKILEEKKNDILTLEEEECKITYLEGEKKMDSDYSYDTARRDLPPAIQYGEFAVKFRYTFTLGHRAYYYAAVLGLDAVNELLEACALLGRLYL